MRHQLFWFAITLAIAAANMAIFLWAPTTLGGH